MVHSLREEEESAKEETRHSSFNDLRHLLLARRNFMQQTVDVHALLITLCTPQRIFNLDLILSFSFSLPISVQLSDQAEQEEEEDIIAQREMTWPYSFSNKRPNISLGTLRSSSHVLVAALRSQPSLSLSLPYRSGESPSCPSQQVVP
jgi:hypothetical protein